MREVRSRVARRGHECAQGRLLDRCGMTGVRLPTGLYIPDFRQGRGARPLVTLDTGRMAPDDIHFTLCSHQRPHGVAAHSQPAHRAQDEARLVYRRIFRSVWPLSQAILRNIAGVAVRFSSVSVSRATHLPARRAAAGLLPWLTPPPWPSLQPQSLPKTSLSWCRARKSAVKAWSRESALLPELAET